MKKGKLLGAAKPAQTPAYCPPDRSQVPGKCLETKRQRLQMACLSVRLLRGSTAVRSAKVMR
jgi:hypothetical protein